MDGRQAVHHEGPFRHYYELPGMTFHNGWIREGLKVRDAVAERAGGAAGPLPDCATWKGTTREDIVTKAMSDEVRITAAGNEDVRSLRELLIIGCKGIAAYAEHAEVLGFEKDEVYGSLMESLASTTKDLPVDEMVNLVMKAGETAVKTMALLDEANTSTYGNRMTEVNLGVRNNPAYLSRVTTLKTWRTPGTDRGYRCGCIHPW